MGQNPCALCGRRYLGSGCAAYHTFFPEGRREAWKQRVMVECAKHGYEVVFKHGFLVNGGPSAIPEKCPQCGGDQVDGLILSYHTFVVDNDKRKYAVALCGQCMDELMHVCKHEADPLPERPPLRGGSEGRGSQPYERAASGGSVPW